MPHYISRYDQLRPTIIEMYSNKLFDFKEKSLRAPKHPNIKTKLLKRDEYQIAIKWFESSTICQK